MKLLSKLLFIVSITVSLVACEKDENKIFYEGGTAPALTSTAETLVLDFANGANTALSFNWTNPNYQFTTGISSQDVNYILEIDTVGANFTNPNKSSVSISKELSKTFKVSELNDILLNTLVLKPKVPHELETRIKSTIGSTAAVLYSNALKLTVTPYAIPPKVPPPTTGKLYIVGSATNGGWNNPVPTPSQEFNQVSETLYEITVDLVGGGAYLLLPKNGDWGTKYNVANDKLPGIENGGDFAKGLDKDIPAPAAAGSYKITVDFQRGKFTVAKQ
jgi:starch-binding outer membrane protein SusE/F